MADTTIMRWFVALCPLLLAACNTHGPTAECSRSLAGMRVSYERYDTNGDNRISRPEYHTVINNMVGLGREKPARDDYDFDSLDRNHDGYVSLDELAGNTCKNGTGKPRS